MACARLPPAVDRGHPHSTHATFPPSPRQHGQAGAGRAGRAHRRRPFFGSLLAQAHGCTNARAELRAGEDTRGAHYGRSSDDRVACTIPQITSLPVHSAWALRSRTNRSSTTPTRQLPPASSASHLHRSCEMCPHGKPNVVRHGAVMQRPTRSRFAVAACCCTIVDIFGMCESTMGISPWISYNNTKIHTCYVKAKNGV